MLQPVSFTLYYTMDFARSGLSHCFHGGCKLQKQSSTAVLLLLVCSCLFSLMYLLTCCLYTCYASPIRMFTCNAHKLGLLNYLHIMWSRLGPIVQCSGCRVTSVSYSNLSLHYLQLHKKFIFYAYNYIHPILWVFYMQLRTIRYIATSRG